MRKLTGILAAALITGTMGATAQLAVYPYGPPAVFGLATEYSTGYYGGAYYPYRGNYDPPGPLNRMGPDVSLNGSFTSGNTTRTGAPEFNGNSLDNGMGQSYAATGVTGALSGSFRAGVGGTGGMADVPPNVSGTAPAPAAVAAAPAAPATAPAATDTPFPAAEVSPDFQQGVGETVGGAGSDFAAGNGATGTDTGTGTGTGNVQPTGRLTYTATYSGNTGNGSTGNGNAGNGNAGRMSTGNGTRSNGNRNNGKAANAARSGDNDSLRSAVPYRNTGR